MKDKHGHDWDALVAIQKDQMYGWSLRLKPEVAAKVSDYLINTNLPANDKGTHRVYRGQDIVQIIMDWPDLKPCYAPNNSNPQDLL